MRYINKLSVVFTVVLVIASMTRVTGQQHDQDFYNIRQLNRIKMALEDSVFKSFQSTSITVYNNAQRDTVVCEYKLSKNKAHLLSSDGTEVVQNDQCKLTLDHKKKKAVIAQRADLFKYVSALNVTDPGFYQAFVTGMAVSDAGGGNKKLTYTFKPASPYRSYDIIYDAANFRIQSIQYAFNMRGSAAPAGGKSSFTVNITFGNYQTGGFTDSAFYTSAFFTGVNGVYSMVVPYNSYTLKNSLNQ